MSVISAVPVPPAGMEDRRSAVAGDGRRDGAGVTGGGLGRRADRAGGDAGVGARRRACSRPRQDGEDRQRRVDAVLVAGHADRDVALLPRRRAGDGLGHGQRAGDEVVGVGEQRIGTAAAGHGDRLAATGHRDGHRAGVTVDGFGDGADAAGSHQVGLGQLTGRAGSDRERREVGPITGRLDHDPALLAGTGAGDRLLHHQQARVHKVVRVGDRGSCGAGSDSQGLARSDDLDGHCAGVPVMDLGDGAIGADRDVVVGLRGRPGGGPGRNVERIADQGAAAAHIDRDSTLCTRRRSGDRLLHDQRTGLGEQCRRAHGRGQRRVLREDEALGIADAVRAVVEIDIILRHLGVRGRLQNGIGLAGLLQPDLGA